MLLLMKGTKASYPTEVDPMLSKLAKSLPPEDDYVYEIKWDGYRILAHLYKGKVTLHSRELQDYTTKYSPIAHALKAFKHDSVLDSEIIVENE